MANNPGIANIKFPELLSCDVKRLTRPRFNHEFNQFNDRVAFSELSGEPQHPSETQADLLGLDGDAAEASAQPKAVELVNIEDYDPGSEQSEASKDLQWQTLGANRHDVAYDGVPADCALNYISTFGKISTGENFRVLFTIQNESSSYPLANISMKVKVQKRSVVLEGMKIDRKRYEALGREEQKKYPLREQESRHFELEHVQSIAQLAPKQQLCFNFNFKIHSSDFYIMFIRFEYTSQYFVEQLAAFRNKQQPEQNQSGPREVKGRDHVIDLLKGTVVKQNYQKFKFEALRPFETATKVEFTNNSYLVQSRVRNVSANKIFVEALEFKSVVGDALELVDLNNSVRLGAREGLFDETVCFHQDEIRQFLFLLRPLKSSFRIDNTQQHRLGSIQITWRNYMGDSGSLELDEVKSQGASASQARLESRCKEIQVELLQPKRLTLEKPERVAFRLHNLTKNYMRLQLSVAQESQHQNEVLICGCYPQIPGKIEGLKSIDFELELLPMVCGVGNISGLRILDMISGKQIELDHHFAKFTVDFSEADAPIETRLAAVSGFGDNLAAPL